jgi:hypothetical protein
MFKFNPMANVMAEKEDYKSGETWEHSDYVVYIKMFYM